MIRRKPLPRQSRPIQRSRIKKRARKPSETLRIYGPPARRKMVSEMPCAACGVVGYSENAHCAPPSEKGTGYKAGYRFIVPLCGPHPSYRVRGIVEGCHQWYDEKRSQFDELFPSFDAQEEAAKVEKLWRASQGEE